MAARMEGRKSAVGISIGPRSASGGGRRIDRRHRAERELCRVGVAFERPASAAAPRRHVLLTVLALEHRGDFQERAVEHGTIVAGEIDQTRFPNQSAELDQMPGALAPLHNPFPRVMSRTLRFKPMSGRYRSPNRLLDRREICPQTGGLCPEKTPRRACASSPSGPR